MEVGIKETQELIKALGVLGVAAKKISKNGLGIDDLQHLVKLGQDFSVILDGFKGMDAMKEEMKNLDQSEVLAIIGSLYEQADAINKA